MDIPWGDVLELLGIVTGEKVIVMEVDLPRSGRVSKVQKSPELRHVRVPRGGGSPTCRRPMGSAFGSALMG